MTRDTTGSDTVKLIQIRIGTTLKLIDLFKKILKKNKHTHRKRSPMREQKRQCEHHDLCEIVGSFTLLLLFALTWCNAAAAKSATVLSWCPSYIPKNA